MDRFTFSLDVKPDTSMRIQSTLGNMRVRAGDAPEPGRGDSFGLGGAGQMGAAEV